MDLALGIRETAHGDVHCQRDGALVLTSRVQRGIDRRWNAVGNSIDNVNRVDHHRISCEFALGAISRAIDPATSWTRR